MFCYHVLHIFFKVEGSDDGFEFARVFGGRRGTWESCSLRTVTSLHPGCCPAESLQVLTEGEAAIGS